MIPLTEFVQAFVLIFAIVDPFAALPLFISLTMNMDKAQQVTTRNTAVVVAMGILVAFALLGKYILFFLNISLEALMIAGGILILLVGVEMVREGDKPRSRVYRDRETGEIKQELTQAGARELPDEEEEDDVGIVPLGIPMLAGPGSISLVIVLMERLNPGVVLAALLAVIAVSWAFFCLAPHISLLMGEKGNKVMTRIMGFLVAGFAIQFILDGVRDWYLENF
jgi:multiple antibiotic resistance protein